MKNLEKILVAGGLWLLLAWAQPAAAMDRWAALSLMESGNNDAAIGRQGEISRFQIKPMVWRQYGVSPTRNPQAALRVAQAIMRERILTFERRFHRAPTTFEYYVLWNAPAQIRKPCRAVVARATRFCNLVNS